MEDVCLIFIRDRNVAFLLPICYCVNCWNCKKPALYFAEVFFFAQNKPLYSWTKRCRRRVGGKWGESIQVMNMK